MVRTHSSRSEVESLDWKSVAVGRCTRGCGNIPRALGTTSLKELKSLHNSKGLRVPLLFSLRHYPLR
jgi:hypothetical protein